MTTLDQVKKLKDESAERVNLNFATGMDKDVQAYEAGLLTAYIEVIRILEADRYDYTPGEEDELSDKAFEMDHMTAEEFNTN